MRDIGHLPSHLVDEHVDDLDAQRTRCAGDRSPRAAPRRCPAPSDEGASSISFKHTCTSPCRASVAGERVLEGIRNQLVDQQAEVDGALLRQSEMYEIVLDLDALVRHRPRATRFPAGSRTPQDRCASCSRWSCRAPRGRARPKGCGSVCRAGSAAFSDRSWWLPATRSGCSGSPRLFFTRWWTSWSRSCFSFSERSSTRRASTSAVTSRRDALQAPPARRPRRPQRSDARAR